MDAATLRSLALRGGGFSTPRLNDSLQAHGAGLSGFFAPSCSDSDRRGGRETAAAGSENGETEARGAAQSPLAAYSGLKSLNLADNGFESLEGMPRLEELRCLFIERNCLTSLAGLARAAPRLATLDASGNRVTEVGAAEEEAGTGTEAEEGRSEAEAAEEESFGCLPRALETLRLSGNDLSGPRALTGLFRRSKERGGGGGESGGEKVGTDSSGSERASESNSSDPPPSSSSSPSLLPLLSTLDLSHCSIADADTVLDLLASLPSLRALYLQGNPFWEAMGATTATATATKGGNVGNGGGGDGSVFVNRRRLAVLAAAPLCTYLNDSPVFGDERAAADAFRESAGNLEAAAAARARFLESAALDAERTTRLLERPPRFVRLAAEEEGDEDPDELDSDDDGDGKEEERGSEEGAECREEAEA